MAVAQSILKKSAKEAAVKVAGDSGSVTVSLDSLAAHGEEPTPSATKNVSIKELYWSCVSGAKVEIARNGVIIFSGISAGSLIFGTGFVDNVEKESDLDVTITGGQSSVWFVLAKYEGYRSLVEIANFSTYDNPTVHGE